MSLQLDTPAYPWKLSYDEAFQSVQTLRENLESKISHSNEEREFVDEKVHEFVKRLTALEKQIPETKELLGTSYPQSISARSYSETMASVIANALDIQNYANEVFNESLGDNQKDDKLKTLFENMQAQMLLYQRALTNRYHTSLPQMIDKAMWSHNTGGCPNSREVDENTSLLAIDKRACVYGVSQDDLDDEVEKKLIQELKSTHELPKSEKSLPSVPLPFFGKTKALIQRTDAVMNRMKIVLRWKFNKINNIPISMTNDRSEQATFLMYLEADHFTKYLGNDERTIKRSYLNQADHLKGRIETYYNNHLILEEQTLVNTFFKDATRELTALHEQLR
jgi:hypothetical protein